MSEAQPTVDAASEAAAQREAERALDLSRMKEIGALHFAMVMGALTLWGAADVWASVTGLAIAHVAAVLNAVIAATVIASTLHEWGHFTGARLSGAVSPVLEKPIKFFFMFDFKMDQNDTRQFEWMSWGGIVTPWLLAIATMMAVPMDHVGRVVLLAAFVTRAVQVALFEVPVVLRAQRSGEPAAELGRQLADGGLDKSRRRGLAIGVAFGVLLLLGT